jgi:hypothetical protein
MVGAPASTVAATPAHAALITVLAPAPATEAAAAFCSRIELDQTKLELTESITGMATQAAKLQALEAQMAAETAQLDTITAANRLLTAQLKKREDRGNSPQKRAISPDVAALAMKLEQAQSTITRVEGDRQVLEVKWNESVKTVSALLKSMHQSALRCCWVDVDALGVHLISISPPSRHQLQLFAHIHSPLRCADDDGHAHSHIIDDDGTGRAGQDDA